MFAIPISVWFLSWSVVACAVSVGSCLKALRLVREMRSLRSLQSEIAEVDASVASLITTIKRIEGRQTARLSRETPTSTSAPSFLNKDELRRYAGIVAGQPVRHTDGNISGDSAQRVRGSGAAVSGGT